MFFIMGITEGRKDFEYGHLMTCSLCGAYGRFNVFMTYTVLSLFFIPYFKWNKHYYVQTSCCNAIYELDPEIGKRISSRTEDSCAIRNDQQPSSISMTSDGVAANVVAPFSISSSLSLNPQRTAIQGSPEFLAV